MTVCEATLCLEGPVDDVAANVKHGCESEGRAKRTNRQRGRTGFLVVLLEKVVKGIVRAVWTVVKTVTQSIRLQGG